MFVIEPQSDRAVARRRSVQIGELTNQGLEVLEGLRDQDWVATAGVSLLTDGQIVRLLEN